MLRPRQRQAAIALGIALIALLSLGETIMADRRMPNPLSPWVWTVLGSVAALGVGRWAWLTWADRREQARERAATGTRPPR
jgi:hypothetical protein